jgi:hypothetical protein
MRIKVNGKKKTSEIKDAFNEAFPFLKIEFVDKPHRPGEGTSLNHILSGNIAVHTINPDVPDDHITINPDQTVASLEHRFSSHFGLPIQVFRKQHDIWIETTRTDKMSLQEQNELGRQNSSLPEHLEPGDRYLEDGQY